MIHPNPAAIVAPAVTFSTWRSTALPKHCRFALDVALAVMTSSVLRGAGELHGLLASEIVSVTVTIAIRKVSIVVSVMIRTAIMIAVAIGIVLGRGRSYQKIGAASPVDPNTVGVESPGRSLSANRMASLMLHGYAAARIGGAVVFPSVLRGAGESILRKALRRSDD